MGRFLFLSGNALQFFYIFGEASGLDFFSILDEFSTKHFSKIKILRNFDDKKRFVILSITVHIDDRSLQLSNTILHIAFPMLAVNLWHPSLTSDVDSWREEGTERNDGCGESIIYCKQLTDGRTFTCMAINRTFRQRRRNEEKSGTALMHGSRAGSPGDGRETPSGAQG